MADIANNTSTTAVMEMSSDASAASFSGRIETVGDSDWIRFDIAFASTWNFFAHMSNVGTEFGDTVLTLWDSTGTTSLASNDDNGVGGRNSFLTLGLDAGTYFLQIVDFSNPAGGDDIGSYTISATRDATTIQSAGVTTGDDTIAAAATGTFLGDRGDDVINLGGSGADAFGEQGDDQLTGSGSFDRMFGGLGSDLLLGLGGNDILFGDAGDDRLEGGNDFDDLNGGDGSDHLLGGANDDKLKGGDGDDLLQGGTGEDFLNGNAGADVMQGGDGGDVYFVDSAGDQVIEQALDTGTDFVNALISYVLADNVELLFLFDGTSPLNGTGNASLNGIYGNDGANTLDGGAAGSDGVVDLLQGFGGNDTFVLGNGNDTVDEVNNGGGIDTITSSITRSLLSYTNIENLTLTGSGAANATGTAGANVLIGNAGINRLEGGAGKDTHTGGGGNDRFVFKTAADSLVGSSRDTITDFTVAGTLERIDLSGFAGTFAFRGTGPFTSAAKEVSYKFSGANTLVKIDLDGDTAAEMEIMLIGKKVLTATDFFL